MPAVKLSCCSNEQSHWILNDKCILQSDVQRVLPGDVAQKWGPGMIGAGGGGLRASPSKMSHSQTLQQWLKSEIKNITYTKMYGCIHIWSLKSKRLNHYFLHWLYFIFCMNLFKLFIDFRIFMVWNSQTRNSPYIRQTNSILCKKNFICK